MAEWCMTHPWMTFFLIYTSLQVIDNIIGNIVRMKIHENEMNVKKGENQL